MSTHTTEQWLQRKQLAKEFNKRIAQTMEVDWRDWPEKHTDKKLIYT